MYSNLLDAYLSRSEGQAPATANPGGTIGPYGRETMSEIGMESLGKSSAMGLAAMAMGAPPGLAAKFGLTSMGPFGALASIGKMAYSGLLDKSYADALAEAGVDASKVDPAAVESAIESQTQARALGMHQADAFGSPAEKIGAAVKSRMDDAGFFGRLDMALQALGDVFSPTSTKIDPITGLHVGQLSNDSMGMIGQAMGLQSSFGDPFGFGIGGGNGGGRSGGRAGGGLSDAGGFGTGEKGDREGGGWV